MKLVTTTTTSTATKTMMKIRIFVGSSTVFSVSIVKLLLLSLFVISVCTSCRTTTCVAASWGGGGVFSVSYKFAGMERSLSALKAHDNLRHLTMLASVDLPLGGTGRPDTVGLYYAMIGIGTPSRDYFVQVDTGSDIMWVNCIQCIECPKRGYHGLELTLYNPKDSLTGKLVSCDQEFCLEINGGPVSGCMANVSCLYTEVYGDGCFSIRYFVKDVVQYDGVSGDLQTKSANGSVIFGCGARQPGDLGSSEDALDGILGFGKSNSSIISQLASSGKVKKMFAHCLDGVNGGGIFAIGHVVQPKVNSTPLVPNQPHYNVNMTAVEVGRDFLNLPTDVFEIGDKKGTIIDSGTTLAYLPELIYEPLVTKILSWQSDVKLQTLRDQYTCFQYSGSIDDGRFMVYWLAKQCNAIQRWEEHDTFGSDLVLSNKLVVYDLENQVIGWTEYNCSSSIKLQDELTGSVHLFGRANSIPKPVTSRIEIEIASHSLDLMARPMHSTFAAFCLFAVPITIVLIFIPWLVVLVESVTLQSDIDALHSVKQAIDSNTIPASSFLKTWNFQMDPCENPGPHFLGILCTVPVDNSSSSNRVLAINLDQAGYDGFLSPAIGNLSELTTLNLNKNNFRRPIPTTITNLVKLTTLSLSENFFTGNLPPRIDRLKSLKVLDVSHNVLSGSIPRLLFSEFRSLTLLKLSNNLFTGRIPVVIGLWQLDTLDLSGNHLSGNLSQFPPNLRTLLLGHNTLSGSISPVARLKSLQALDLSANRFSGSFAYELVTYDNLTAINLGNNQFSGQIPVEYGQKMPTNGEVCSWITTFWWEVCHLSSAIMQQGSGKVLHKTASIAREEYTFVVEGKDQFQNASTGMVVTKGEKLLRAKLLGNV
ncbi:unnamed protein product [Camellia sinensis]